MYNLDEAENILKFQIKHTNTYLKINNGLFEESILKKLLKKVGTIKKYYSELIKGDHKEKLNNFLESMKSNSKIKDFEEKLISFMIIASEEIYYKLQELFK